MVRAFSSFVLLIGFCLLSGATVVAQEESTAQLIAKAPDAKAHPQASAIYLLDSKRVEVDENFGTTEEVRKVIKILNARGREAYGQMEFDYDAKEDTVEIVKAVTYDGQKEIAAPQEGITDITDGDESNSYGSRRTKVISMPAMKEGVTIELIYRIKSPKPWVKGKFYDAFSLQRAVPMQAIRYTLVVPKHVPFKHVVTRAQCTPEITPDGDRLVYRWERRDVKEIVPEQVAMPPAEETLARLYVTNWNSWEEAGESYAKLVAPAVQVTESVRNFVSEATKSKHSDQERLAALYYAVATKIRYVALGFGAESYGPHSAADTLQKGYGCCRDKAALLVAALSEVGIKSHLVLINASHQELNLDAPAPFWFDHAIVAVEAGNEYLFLDPTGENCTFGDLPVTDQNKLVLICKQGDSRLVKTPLFPASKNTVSTVIDAQLTDDGNMQGTVTWKLEGHWASVFRGILKSTNPQERGEWLTQAAAELFPGGRMSDPTFSDVADVSAPVTISFKFTSDGATTEVGELLMVKLPEGLLIDPITAKDTAAKERQYPIALVANSVSTDVRLRLPAGYSVQSLPKGVKSESKVGRYVSTYAMDNGVLKMRREVAINLDRIPAADYALLKDLVGTKTKELRKQLVLKKEEATSTN